MRSKRELVENLNIEIKFNPDDSTYDISLNQAIFFIRNWERFLENLDVVLSISLISSRIPIPDAISLVCKNRLKKFILFYVERGDAVFDMAWDAPKDAPVEGKLNFIQMKLNA